MTDDYIRYFVERVFAPAESAEAEQEVEDPELQQIEQRNTALEYQSALQNSIAEASSGLSLPTGQAIHAVARSCISTPACFFMAPKASDKYKRT